MTQVARAFIFIILGTLFWGCAPTDQHVLPFKDRLNSGKPIVYQKRGEQPPGCFRGDWEEARLKEEDIADLMLAGFGFDIKAGSENCYRVGSRIPIQDSDKRETVEGPALVEIEKIILQKPTARDLKNLNKNFEERLAGIQASERPEKSVVSYFFSNFEAKIKNELDFSQRERDGSIQITFLKYVKNSAPRSTENFYKTEAVKRYQNSLEYFEETSAEKPLLKGCRTAKPVWVEKSLWDMMQNKVIKTAWVIKPGALCIAQDSTIEVTEKGKPDHVLGKIKVGVVREMTLNKFEDQFLTLGENKTNETLPELKAEIEKSFANARPNTHLNLFDFEVVP